MNVIIGNKQQAVLESLNIDIIKSLTGEFEVDDLINTFKNFYYQRMILDITAIKNYQDIRVLQKLSIALDMEKLILLLDNNDDSTSNDYLSKLISMGIYNFTRNAEGIMYLYNNPNSYRDVAQYHQLDTENIQVVNNSGEGKAPCRIIGVQNLTEASGATTFVYLMMKQLRKNYNVVAVEVDKHDFNFFQSGNLASVVGNQLGKFIADNNDKDVILIDVNKSTMALGMCQEIIYLVEPSIIKLNRLMYIRRNAFKELDGRKIVLNQSLLSSKDVLELQYEARAKFFFNMPPLNERDERIPIMDTFLYKLGFTRQDSGEQQPVKKKRGLFQGEI